MCHMRRRIHVPSTRRPIVSLNTNKSSCSPCKWFYIVVNVLLCMVVLHSKCTRALTYENLCQLFPARLPNIQGGDAEPVAGRTKDPRKFRSLST